MSPVDLLALAMWPLGAAGIWLGYKALPLHAKDFRRVVLRGLSTVALFAFAGALLAVAIFFPHHSAISVAMEYSIIAALGLLLLWSAWRMHLTRLKSVVWTTLGFICLGWGFYHLAGDFLLWRVQAEGHVSDKRSGIRGGCRRCLPEYFIGVGAKQYKATEQVFEAVAMGQRVHVEVGRISGRIMSVQALPF